VEILPCGEFLVKDEKVGKESEQKCEGNLLIAALFLVMNGLLYVNR
jgi:hypothetical protein